MSEDSSNVSQLGWVIAAIISLVTGYLVAVTADWIPPIESPFGSTPSSFVGGCEPFAVHAQNRYPPAGAKSRDAPYREAADVESFSPNELIVVDGWVRTRAAYPSNSAPFNSDAWFHLADDSGWVAFAAVRAVPTVFDETGMAEDRGDPVPLEDDCFGTYRS